MEPRPLLAHTKKTEPEPSNLKFFEEFFIIGVQKKDIEEFQLGNPGYLLCFNERIT